MGCGNAEDLKPIGPVQQVVDAAFGGESGELEYVATIKVTSIGTGEVSVRDGDRVIGVFTERETLKSALKSEFGLED